jgi:hypothetical protein
MRVHLCTCVCVFVCACDAPAYACVVSVSRLVDTSTRVRPRFHLASSHHEAEEKGTALTTEAWPHLHAVLARRKPAAGNPVIDEPITTEDYAALEDAKVRTVLLLACTQLYCIIHPLMCVISGSE